VRSTARSKITSACGTLSQTSQSRRRLIAHALLLTALKGCTLQAPAARAPAAVSVNAPSGWLGISRVGRGYNRPGDAEPNTTFAAITKLATTREPVRILVYGQSISQQTWWLKTKTWLRATYPSGNLIMEMHARGGCASQCLIGHEAWFQDGRQYNRLPEDVFAFKPDLIIFHVLGDHVDYGYIMDAFQNGCAAFDHYRTHDGFDISNVHCTPEQRRLAEGYHAPEVLVQNDFITSPIPVQCPRDPTPADWACFMNEKVIPEQVARHGYGLQDNFHEWPRVIAAAQIDARSLLQPDMTHLSDPAGTDLMFERTVLHLSVRGGP
jgi:hypothetical protein